MKPEEIYERIKNDKSNLFVTGPAGTGKTHILTFLAKQLTQDGRKFQVVAPTGAAAQTCNGRIIHSFFRIDPYNTQDCLTVQAKRAASSGVEFIDLLIIDEISMVSNRLFMLVDLILQKVRNCTRPFGGAQVVIFGDFCQLSPVAKRDAPNFKVDSRFFPDGWYCFQTELWRDLAIQTIHLKQQFRQANDEEYASLLCRVRNGHTTVEDCHLLTRRVLRKNPEWDQENFPTHLFGCNSDVAQLNAQRLAMLEGDSIVLQKKIYWTNAAGVRLQESTLPPRLKRGSTSGDDVQDVELKIGARVMVRANVHELKLFNGMVGTVVSWDTKGTSVKIRLENGQEREVNWRVTRTEVADNVISVVEYMPLCLAWAITIHKAQGITLDSVVVDLSSRSIFSPYQAYVALSRGRCLEKMFLLNFSPESLFKRDDRVTDFYAYLPQNEGGECPMNEVGASAFDYDNLAHGSTIPDSSTHPSLLVTTVKHLTDGSKKLHYSVVPPAHPVFLVTPGTVMAVGEKPEKAQKNPAAVGMHIRFDDILTSHVVESLSLEIKGSNTDADAPSDDVDVYLKRTSGSGIYVRMPSHLCLTLSGLGTKYFESAELDSKQFLLHCFQL